MDNKSQLRESFRQKRQALSQMDIDKASTQLCTRLERFLGRGPFNSIATYTPIQNEVSILSFIKTVISSKIVAMPRYNPTSNRYQLAVIKDLDTDLIPSRYGILEPKPSCPPYKHTECELWLVPGIVFDEQGHRIGFGSGIYDTLLARTEGLKVGVAYDWQVIDTLPHEGHDISMDTLITDARLKQVH